jgi:hypothetical protein
MRRAGTPNARVATAIAWVWAVALVMYGTFEHWAGDGSFGPRYLVPLLPLACLPLAFALMHASRARRALAWLLAVAGLLVQVGGVAIYFGAQMREAGDYPYTRALNDPRFMSESHFNPRYTPIAGHWRMLVRNASEHVHGQAPRVSVASAPAATPESPLGPGGGAAPDARLGIGAEDQARASRADSGGFASYAGIPLMPIAFALGLLLFAVLWAITRVAGAVADETQTS